jgi:UDP-N-acetyl-2-amino-2-deoxyglucuronate dehydrogenase
MLGEVECEVVTICTPSGLHPAQGVLAAKTGHHVVTEKPMAISLKGADELVAACDAGESPFVRGEAESAQCAGAAAQEGG